MKRTDSQTDHVPDSKRRKAFQPRHLASALLAVGVAMTAMGNAEADPNVVNLETAREKLEAGGVVMIDIREPREHATGVAPGARLIPMSQLGQRLAEIPIDPAKPVYLICNTQNRSAAVLRALRETGGYSHVRFVDGGMSGWVRRGWPVVPPGG
jgi:rhodanese-related sulfurtransferase